jgi:hypothetical protein
LVNDQGTIDGTLRGWWQDYRSHSVARNLLRDRLTVEELAADCLDVRELHRAGLLKEHSVTLRPMLRWPKIATLRTDRFVIQVSLRNQVVPQYIHLSWTPCQFGSYRPWMLCPHCRKRVARLFKGLSGYFCRECVGDPPYESQLRNDRARAYLRAYRLRQRIGGGRPVIDPVRERPYRMWRKTYNSICAEIERLERPLIGNRIVKRAPLLIRPLSY